MRGPAGGLLRHPSVALADRLPTMIAEPRSGREGSSAVRASAALESGPALVAEPGIHGVRGCAMSTGNGLLPDREIGPEARQDNPARGVGHGLQPVTSPFGLVVEAVGRHRCHFIGEVSEFRVERAELGDAKADRDKRRSDHHGPEIPKRVQRPERSNEADQPECREGHSEAHHDSAEPARSRLGLLMAGVDLAIHIVHGCIDLSRLVSRWFQLYGGCLTLLQSTPGPRHPLKLSRIVDETERRHLTNTAWTRHRCRGRDLRGPLGRVRPYCSPSLNRLTRVQKFRDRSSSASSRHRSGVSFRFESGSRGQHDLPEIMGGGVAIFDADGDGQLDVYFCNGGPIDAAPGKPDPPCRLYRNKGGWQFEDITDRAGAPGPSYAMGAAVGDYDADGRLDLFVTGWRDQRLYRNLGGGRFEDVTRGAGLISESWSTAAAFADLDGDGDLDLFVANYLEFDPKSPPFCAAPDGRRDYCGPEDFPAQPDRLYRNNGDGTFTDVSESAGIELPEGRGLGVIIAELTGDQSTRYLRRERLLALLAVRQPGEPAIRRDRRGGGRRPRRSRRGHLGDGGRPG